jgi:uncharacterized membrane protein
MSSVRDRYQKLFSSGEGTDRLEFFSDAVFAIAMTLLVIDLQVPDGENLNAAAVLAGQWTGFFGYLLSFAIIALNWMAHHRKFRVIHRFDTNLIRLNFVLLFLVTFVPFPTALLADTGGQFASVALYAAVVGGLSLAQLAMWTYAYRAKLTTDDVDQPMFRYVALGLIPVPAVFFSSILIAIWDPNIAMWWWFAIIPASVILGVFRRRLGDQSKSSESLRSSDDKRS